MKVEKIIADLGITQKIIEGWGSGSKISALERDLVLEKLRTVYEDVLTEQSASVVESYPQNVELFDAIDLSDMIEPLTFGVEQAYESQPMRESAAFEVPNEHISEPEPDEVDTQIESESEVMPETEPAIEIETEVEPDQEVEALAEVESIAVNEQELEQEFEPVVVPEPMPEPEAMPEEPVISVVEKQVVAEIKETTPINDVVSQSLFSEGSIPTKPKIDRRIILSLYGDEPMQESVSNEMYVVDKKDKFEEKKIETIHESDIVVPQLTTFDKPHTEVLGDVIGKGTSTVGDIMFSVTDKVDMATKVVTESSTSLRKMIGINDKFQMIRDLFNGNAASYEQAINALEVFTDLDDALIYIHETYSWNPNSEGVKLLIELLTRKLS